MIDATKKEGCYPKTIMSRIAQQVGKGALKQRTQLMRNRTKATNAMGIALKH